MFKNRNSKPKLLYVVEATGGGVLSYLVDLANALCDEFDIYIAYGRRKETPANLESLFNNKIHLIPVRNFTRSINLKKDIAAFFELKKIAKKIKPDIVHLNSSKAGAIGRFAFNGNRVPLFYTPHGYSFLMSNYSSSKQKLFEAIEKICTLRTCTTISCGKSEYKATLKLTKNALNIDDGINIKELDELIKLNQNKIVKKDKPLTVFTLSRMSFQKNPELFNEIAKRLPDVKFVWIGDGELKDELTAPNIEVTGWLNRKDAVSKAMEADVFLLTSLWEGLPISLLEAMYMKKLCIVSDVVGNRDVINEFNGYRCSNLDQYIHILNNLKNKKMPEDKINQAHKEIIENYNSIIMANKYKNIYINSLQ